MSDNDKVTLPTEASDVTQGDGPVLEERYIQPLADIYKEVCVYDISRKIDMGQSAVSHQLRILRNARLVQFRRAGKEVYYSLADRHVYTLLEVGLEHVSE